MKVVFFGSSNYVLPVIEKLKKNFEIELVITTEKELKDPIITFCKKNQLPYLSVSNLSNPNHKSYILNLMSLSQIMLYFEHGTHQPRKQRQC